MSEERAGYSFVEAPLAPEKKRFSWLHNKPDGTACSTQDASTVRWDPQSEQVVCTDCGMIFHPGASNADDLMQMLEESDGVEVTRLEARIEVLSMTHQEYTRLAEIVLKLLLEAYGKPFTVPNVYFEANCPRLKLFYRDEHAHTPYGHTFWVEKAETEEENYGPSPFAGALGIVLIYAALHRDLGGSVPEEEKPTDA